MRRCRRRRRPTFLPGLVVASSLCPAALFFSPLTRFFFFFFSPGIRAQRTPFPTLFVAYVPPPIACYARVSSHKSKRIARKAPRAAAKSRASFPDRYPRRLLLSLSLSLDSSLPLAAATAAAAASFQLYPLFFTSFSFPFTFFARIVFWLSISPFFGSTFYLSPPWPCAYTPRSAPLCLSVCVS